MLTDSFKKMNKNQKVEIHDIKSFIGKGDNNNDGKIEKKELRQIILKSVKIQAPPAKKKINYDD
jgi:hypothetical protein